MIRLPFTPAAALRALPFASIAALVICAAVICVASPAQAIPTDTVVLQGLDKITARVSTIDVPVGGTVEFGALKITARACDKHPPEETPEAAAFLEVVEVKPDEKPILRFSGWMFASSPALSALEHPVYDLIVLDCVNKSGAPASDDDAAPAPGTTNGQAPANQAPANQAPANQSPTGAAPSKSSKPSGGSSQ